MPRNLAAAMAGFTRPAALFPRTAWRRSRGAAPYRSEPRPVPTSTCEPVMRLPRVLAAVAAVAVITLVACGKPPKPAAPPGPRPIATPRDLVARMHDTWKERYFRTMVFRQRNTLYLRDGSQQLSEWIEYQSVPRRLRIEF